MESLGDEMKLSDAIVMGSTNPKVPFNPWNFCACLIGTGIHVFYDKKLESYTALSEAEKRWPWLLVDYPVPDEVRSTSTESPARDIISMWAFGIKRGYTTFEQAVEWIRSAEPEETEATSVVDPVTEAVCA